MTSEQLIETLTSIGLTPRATSAKGTPHPNVVGVEVHRPADAIYDLCRALVEAGTAHLIPQLNGFGLDSLGTSNVIYWPHLPWPIDGYGERTAQLVVEYGVIEAWTHRLRDGVVDSLDLGLVHAAVMPLEAPDVSHLTQEQRAELRAMILEAEGHGNFRLDPHWKLTELGLTPRR